mgnify:CR=1 FL=1
MKLLKEQKAQTSIEFLLLLGAIVGVSLLVGYTVKSVLNGTISGP